MHHKYVRCIYAADSKDRLVNGMIYDVVQKPNEHTVCLKNVSGCWDASRFEECTTQSEVGPNMEVIVRDVKSPKKVKRAELWKWFHDARSYSIKAWGLPIDICFAVTDASGHALGMGSTPEKAIIDARNTLRGKPP